MVIERRTFIIGAVAGGIKRGAYRIRVRSTDGKGRGQNEGPKDIFPDGATGQQVIKVTVA